LFRGIVVKIWPNTTGKRHPSEGARIRRGVLRLQEGIEEDE